MPSASPAGPPTCMTAEELHALISEVVARISPRPPSRTYA